MESALKSLLPPAVIGDAEKAVAALAGTVMMRVNFIPGVRQRLGWRGVRGCSVSEAGLTAKVSPWTGVFGLHLRGAEMDAKTALADYDLYYFPAPQEPVVESFSVAACCEVLQEDYLDKVREFAAWPMKKLFHTASFSVIIDPDSYSVGVCLSGTERQLILSGDGITIKTDEENRTLVLPGGIDQDLPAWDIAGRFFSVLSGSFSFCFNQEPTRLQRWRTQAGYDICYSDGRCLTAPLEDYYDRKLLLCWGTETGLTGREISFGQPELDWQAPQTKPAEYQEEIWWNPYLPGAGFSIDKLSMGIHEHPRLIVLTGFLGAGKTSFLKHFIEYQAQRHAFVAVVQNEIGARNLDSLLLGQYYAVTEMDEGCICCSLVGNLKQALTEILSDYQPDFVVLETTGLANPGNVLVELEELEDQLDFCSVTTVVDASRGVDPLQKYPVARNQLLLADTILLNKVSDQPADSVDILESFVLGLNPAASVFRTDHGDISPGTIYGVNFNGNFRKPGGLSEPNMTRATHEESGLSSCLITWEESIGKEQLLQALADCGPRLLRAKGILQFQGEEDAVIFQYVPGLPQQQQLESEDSGDRFVVLIGENIQEIEKRFKMTMNI